MPDLPPIEIDPKTFLRDHCALPALPRLLSQIQGLIHSEDVTTGKVEKLVSVDPALVAQILKVVNSAYYALPKRIIKLRYAIDFLGLNEIYRMILSLYVVNTLSIEERGELNRFWHHSYYTALCTKHLSRQFKIRVPPDELWSASILHDVGKLVYLKFFPDHYAAIRNYRDETGCLFSQAEEQFPFPTSGFLGTLLCDHWNLPEKVKVACESHGLVDLRNTTGDSVSARFIRLICQGNLIAVLAAEMLNDETRLEVTDALRDSLACSQEAFESLMEEIRGLADEVAAMGS